jgi:hypothetical protein
MREALRVNALAVRKSKQRETAELEAELLRLNALVRERREQLARLEKCPNPECPCRLVWKEHVARGLASQMGKIRRQVRGKAETATKARGTIGRAGKRT